MVKPLKITCLVAVLIAAGGFFYSHSNLAFAKDVCIVHVSQPQGQASQPNPNQDNSFNDFIPAQKQESDKYCERPSAKDPDVGETDPNKIGCKCVRKCIEGKPEEGPQIHCKQPHCKKDNCACPDPCKKT